MTPRNRDRLWSCDRRRTLITLRQTAAELQLTEHQIRRLFVRLKEVGDRA